MKLPFRPQVTGNTLTQLNLVDPPRKIPAKDARQYLTMLVIVEAAVILLVVTNTAASTVTREKEDGTLDLLLTTPITSRYYIWGKLRGLVYFVLPLISIPVASVAIFIVYDLLQLATGSLTHWLVFPEAVLIMAPTLIVLSAFAAITGMNMSLRCRTTIRAVMLSVAVVLGICGMLGFCGNKLLLANNSDNLVSLAVSAFSPITVLMALTDPFEFGGGVFGTPTMIDGARITLFLFSIAATGAYTAVVWSMYRNMVKNFDMTIRRQSR
jgi:ABC-type Na+ efflux pump permease subunit